MTNGFATRDDFLGATKRRFREVVLPGGKKARIRSLNAAEWAEADSANYDFKKGGGLSRVGVKESDLRLIAACVCDDDGNPLFNVGDIQALGTIDTAILLPLIREIKEHCGISRDVEDTLKNFAPTTDSASRSSSAEPSPTP
jgi:hypothetical protein